MVGVRKDKSVFLWKSMWDRKRNQIIPPLQIPKYYLDKGFEIINANNPGQADNGLIKIYDMANPYMPKIGNWLDLYREPKKLFKGTVFNGNVPLTEDIKQAGLITNSVVVENEYFPGFKLLPNLKIIDHNDNVARFKNILYQSKKWDPNFKMVEPLIKDKFRLHYKKIKQIPEDVTSSVFFHNIINFCESMKYELSESKSDNRILSYDHNLNLLFLLDSHVDQCSSLHALLNNETGVQTSLTTNQTGDMLYAKGQLIDTKDMTMHQNNTYKLSFGMPNDNKAALSKKDRLAINFSRSPLQPVRWQCTNNLVCLNTKPLGPWNTRINNNENSDLATQTYPISPLIDFLTYGNEHNPLCPSVMKLISQQSFSLANKPGQLFYPNVIVDANNCASWTPAQYTAKGILTCYGHLAQTAFHLYGSSGLFSTALPKNLEPFDTLPTPLCCNYIGTDGQHLCFVSFQLNHMPPLLNHYVNYNDNDVDNDLTTNDYVNVVNDGENVQKYREAFKSAPKNMAWVNYQKGWEEDTDKSFMEYNFNVRYLKEVAEREKMLALKAENIDQYNAILYGNPKNRVDFYRKYNTETSEFIAFNPDILNYFISFYLQDIC